MQFDFQINVEKKTYWDLYLAVSGVVGIFGNLRYPLSTFSNTLSLLTGEL